MTGVRVEIVRRVWPVDTELKKIKTFLKVCNNNVENAERVHTKV